MNSFYETLSEINPNAQNIALTVLSKDKQGAKCLVSAGKIAWESDSFFSEHADETPVSYTHLTLPTTERV